MEHLDNIHIDHFFSSDVKTFIGEIQVRNNASGTLRSLVSGSLYRRDSLVVGGSRILWHT